MSIDYIPITERCNMHCLHCSASATEKGKDMSWETFVQAIKVSMDSPMITLGGGEPTLHPQFMEMLDYAISERPSGTINIITNGSNTEISLRLADMAEQGIILAGLSQDQWHDPIDEAVVVRFKSIGCIATPDIVARIGRGVNIPDAIDKCGGLGLSVDTQGNVFLCGCHEECIGTIWGYTVPDLHCENIAHALKTGEYICAGYCSRGHIVCQNPEHAQRLAEKRRHKCAIIDAEIEVLSLLIEYQEGKVLLGDVRARLEQCAMEAKGLTAEEFLAIVDKYWGTQCLTRIS